MKIWKFEIKRLPHQKIKIPNGYIVLDIQIQDGNFVLWAMCNPENTQIDVEIFIKGTGGTVNSNEYYLKTVQEGEMVWHFFTNNP